MDNLNDHDPITVIEFCAGYGGLGLGIKGVLGERMRLIGLCELEGFAQANLISKMEAGLMEQVPVWSNLLTFPYRKFRGLVDIAAAGIPCQPHSLAGKRSGGGDQRFLFDDWLCGLEQMQPRAIFIENVEGFLSSKMPDGTLCVEWTIKRLEAMGYQTATGIFSAREVGAPHQRKRVFILAMANNCGKGLQGNISRLLVSSEPRPNCIEQSSVIEGGSKSGEIQKGLFWPSRPGQPQHGWEPPRVVANSTSQRANGGQQFRGEECGQGGALPLQSDDSGESVGNANSLNRRTPTGGRIDDAEVGSAGEIMGNTSTAGLQRCGISGEMDSKSRGAEGEGSEPASAIAVTSDAQRGEGDLANAGSVCGESDGVIGNAEVFNGAGQAGGQREAQARRAGATQLGRQIKFAMGLPIDESSNGVGDSELSSLSNQELAEIYEWMERCDNRTDELRLLGNGVVPATATLAFQTLLAELLAL